MVGGYAGGRMLYVTLSDNSFKRRKIKSATLQNTVEAKGFPALFAAPTSDNIRWFNLLVFAIFTTAGPVVVLADFSFQEACLMQVESLPCLQPFLLYQHTSFANIVFTLLTAIVVILDLYVVLCTNLASYWLRATSHSFNSV